MMDIKKTYQYTAKSKILYEIVTFADSVRKQ